MITVLTCLPIFYFRIQQQSKLVSRLWHDRPMSALETAIYWTEYVARYHGAPNLPATSIQKPWYQQLHLDVLAFVALVMYILTKVICKIISACCCSCCGSEEKQTYDEERRTRRVKFE